MVEERMEQFEKNIDEAVERMIRLSVFGGP